MEDDDVPPPTAVNEDANGIPVPVHEIHNVNHPDFVNIQSQVNNAVAALPLDAPVAFMVTAGNQGVKTAVLVRAGNKFNFEGWLASNKTGIKHPDWGVGAVYYPWRK